MGWRGDDQEVLTVGGGDGGGGGGALLADAQMALAWLGGKAAKANRHCRCATHCTKESEAPKKFEKEE